jgi:hypothetical protein
VVSVGIAVAALVAGTIKVCRISRAGRSASLFYNDGYYNSAHKRGARLSPNLSSGAGDSRGNSSP